MADIYIRGKDGRPQLVGKTADPQLPGRVTALEERVDAIEAAPGGVQLSDAVDSESSTTAATSKAVKTAYDKGVAADATANAAQSAASAAKTAADAAQDSADAAQTAAAAAQTKADSAYTEATKSASTTVVGRVKLSDAVDNESSTTAATSKAAKTAYDKAAAATFPAGTKLLFHQAAAPTGWTKQTTVNDAALRVVSGTTGGGTGGSLAFSTLFAAGKAVTLSGNVGATTLTVAQLASHTHKMRINGDTGTAQSGAAPQTSAEKYQVATYSTGSSASHTHTLSGKATIALNVKYTDVIICAKA